MYKKLIILFLCLYHFGRSYSQELAQFGTSTTTNCLSGDCLNGFGTCTRYEGQFTGLFENGHPYKGILTIGNFSTLKHYWNGIWDGYTGYSRKEVTDFQTISFAGLTKCNCLTKIEKKFKVTTRTTTIETLKGSSSKDDIDYVTKKYWVNKTNKRVYVKCINVEYSRVQGKRIYNDISFAMEPGEEIDGNITLTNTENFDSTMYFGPEVHIATYSGYPKKVTQFDFNSIQNKVNTNPNTTRISNSIVNNSSSKTNKSVETTLDFELGINPKITMTYDEAIKYCSKLGPGWRIPNKAEMDEIYKLKDKLQFFGYEFWTSDIKLPDKVWRIYMGDGSKLLVSKFEKIFVWPIRNK